jgi:GH15 family glucan-1,4-alpha-glucosidase
MTSWGTDAAALTTRVDTFVAERDASAVLAAEREDWQAWHAVEVPPAGLSADELAVWRQSTAVLRMAQVREDGGGDGQILASLPPGIWNIAWPRDGAYATVGLVKSGHLDEARDFLDFIVKADAGQYAPELGIADYLVSACRYTGDGVEESDGAGCPDGSDAGPNIELDDFGLFLWAYGEYAAARPDDPWLEASREAVLTGVADPLVALIDGNRDLLVPDSSIWERHWDTCFPNGRKRFAYSSIQAVAGLRVAARISGDARYTDAADRIRRGLLRTADAGGPVLVRDLGDRVCPFVASAPEETCDGCGPYDASVIEIVNHGIIRPESALAVGTAEAMRDALAMPHWPGFKRNDDGTGSSNPYPWYDDQEWVVIDLRMAEAYARIGEATDNPVFRQDADVLFGWVTAQARTNHDLIPELLSDGRWTPEDDADRVRPGIDLGAEFQGAVPMAGFGPGAYILAAEVLR